MKATKLFSIIILLCAIAAFVMSIIEIHKNVYAEAWKPTEIYEFCNKNIDWD